MTRANRRNCALALRDLTLQSPAAFAELHLPRCTQKAEWVLGLCLLWVLNWCCFRRNDAAKRTAVTRLPSRVAVDGRRARQCICQQLTSSFGNAPSPHTHTCSTPAKSTKVRAAGGRNLALLLSAIFGMLLSARALLHQFRRVAACPLDPLQKCAG